MGDDETWMRQVVEHTDAVVVARLEPDPTGDRRQVIELTEGIRAVSVPDPFRANAETVLVFKGPVASTFDVESPPSSCSYDSLHEPGYHLMLLDESDGSYSTGQCSAFPVDYDERTGELSSEMPHRQAVITTLMEIAPPESVASSATPHSASGNTLLALLVVAMGVSVVALPLVRLIWYRLRE